MIRNSKLLRVISAFLILNTVLNTMAPTISLALTAGPTAPEFSSFEPVDTTDMVNLLTGDLAYNTPIIEVPGPSGGYPLSLSYHAGIQPNVEASWVGLGWTLNPGSISRLVNGYADDHKEADVVDRLRWNGEDRTTYSIGISAGYGRGASVTAGLSFTQDSQYGFSVNPYVAGQAELIAGSGIGISANSMTGSAQITAPGMQYLNMIENKEFSYGPVTISRKGVNVGLGFKGATLDISINSKGVKPKLGLSGFSRGVSREGRVNRETSSDNITIPTPWGFGVRLGRDYQRIWIDESATVKTNGSLYFPTTIPDYTYLNQRGFDTYDLLYQDQGLTKLDPEREASGSFPDYDDFTVHAQGISGSFRPYHHYEFLYRQNRNDDQTPTVRSVPLGATGNRLGFRFINDFSNRFLFDPDKPNYVNPGFAMDFETDQIVAGKNGYGYEENILGGSRLIKHFTNKEIRTDPPAARSKGFIEATGFERYYVGLSADDQIGSFRITNESGVTYHFSIPVYSYDEYSYSERVKPEGGTETFNEVTKNTKYAYTWLLTAITGPDYVDRPGVNGEGLGRLDKSDFGYWVDFGYQKWDDDYQWRNPEEGFNNDIDHNFRNYSYGKKEIYYLNYIRTASHIALFDKSSRLDGKSVIGKNGGFSEASATLLKLDGIYLLSDKEFEQIGGQSILEDLGGHRPAIVANSIQSVKFNYDNEYKLSPGTINSFDPSAPNDKKGKLALTSLSFLGKGGADLLPSMRFSYELKNPERHAVKLAKELAAGEFSFFAENFNLEFGNLVKLTVEEETLYGVVLQNSYLPNMHKLKVIEGDWEDLDKKFAVIVETKNPPYNKDKVDIWGLYKSDFVPNSSARSKNTTALSAKSIDVWSLRSIKTIVGAEINLEYEPDYYDEVVYSGSPETNNANATQQALRIKSVTRINNSLLKVLFHNDGFDLNKIFKPGEKADAVLVGAYQSQDLAYVSGGQQGCPCPTLGFGFNKSFTSQSSVTIQSINNVDYSITLNATDQQFTPSLNTTLLSNTDYSSSCTNVGGEPASCSYQVVNNQWPSFIAGGLVFAPNKVRHPGGIRVKSIEIDDLHHTKRAVSYNYGYGVTSYEPAFIPPFEMTASQYEGIPAIQRSQQYEQVSSLISQAVLGRYSNMLNIAREVPGPGVMYQNVRVRGTVSVNDNRVDDPNYKEFEFQTLTRDMVKYTTVFNATEPGGSSGGLGQPPVPPLPVSGITYTNVTRSEIIIDDLSTAVGNLKSIKTYNHLNELLEESKYNYLHDEHLNTLSSSAGYPTYANTLSDKFQSQGSIYESFADARVVKSLSSASYTLIGVMSKRRSYPSIMTGQTVKNYKTGIETSTKTLAFDFFSGEQIETLSKDGYGNAFVTKSRPAYEIYPEMGLGIYSGNKHMLSQTASSYVYKVDSQNYLNLLGLVTASVQTWSNQVPVLKPGDVLEDAVIQSDVWRKHASFTFIGDNNVREGTGLYPINDNELPVFDAWSKDDEVPVLWQKDSEIKLYDVHSRILEAVDVNEIPSAVITSVKQDQVLAAVTNAKYGEFAYSGAEDEVSSLGAYGGNVFRRNGEEVFRQNDSDELTTHTGQKALRLGSTTGRAFEFSFVAQANKKYQASVWTNSTGGRLFYSVDGITTSAPGIPSSTKKAGSWYLVTIDLPVQTSAANVVVWCAIDSQGDACNFDDFRVYPYLSGLTSYVYNAEGKLSHILDNNNLFTKFRYDAMGRLINSYRESFTNGVVKINEQRYHYANQ